MNRMAATLSLSLFLLVYHARAQPNYHRIDSLKNVLLSHSHEDSIKATLLNEIGYEYWIVNPDLSVVYGIKAFRLSEKLNYKKGQARANRVIGVAHWAKGNLNDALLYLIDSQQGYTAINDKEGQANATLNIGMVYADLEQFDIAVNKYHEAIDLFSALGLHSRKATAYTKLASVFIEQDKMEKAEEYLMNSLKIHTENNFKYGVAEVHNRLGILYLKKNDTELAYNHIQISMIIGSQILDVDGLTSNLIQRARINRADHRLEAADRDVNKALRQARENHLKKYELMAYDELKELKKLQGNLQEALHYSDLYTKLKDSLFDIEKTKQIAYIEFKNQLENKDREVMLLKTKEKTDNLIKWMLITGICLVLLTVFILYKNFKKDKKLLQKDRELLHSKNALAQQALENSGLKQKELKQELEFKNKELASYALNVVQKNEILQSIQDKVRQIKENSDQVNPVLRELQGAIKQHLSADKNWEDFKRAFEKIHSDFYPKLMARHPDLKANDLKLCSLARLNLNIKEMASIMGVSPESVKTARYRLRKKLDLKPKQEIITYLIDLENC